MTNQSTLITETIREQALEWVIKLTSGEVSDGMRECFTSWYDQTELHSEAFSEAQQLWIGLNKFSEQNSTTTTVDTPSNVVPISSSSKRKTATIRKIFTRVTLPMAASIAAMAIVIQTFFSFTTLQGLSADYVALRGEQEHITLADGSQVRLNTDSALDVNYSDSQRSLTLYSGEADFKVSKDPTRAFQVTAGEWEITALGTEFIVKALADSDELTVVVLEHSVSVNHVTDPSKRYVVEEGQVLTISKNSLTHSTQVTDSETGWLSNRLVFNQTPLSEAIEEIDRYFPGRILLRNEALENQQVNGAFDLQNMNAIILALEDVLPISVDRFTDYLVVIR